MDDRKVQKERQKCNVYIDDRKHISISGVEDVDNFDETGFIAITSLGALNVKGANLHINKLNVDTGELLVDGDIDSCVFNDGYGGKSGGFFAKIFK